MADSLLDLGSGYEILSTGSNWAGELRTKILQARTVTAFPGTIRQSVDQSARKPVELSKQYLLQTSGIKAFLDFWTGKYGRHKAFWVYTEYTCFRLASAITSGNTTLTCQYNYFDTAYQGHERLYMLLRNGDRITRKITAADLNSGNLRLTVSAVNANVALADILEFGRILLCRFDNDTLQVKYLSRDVAEVNVGFRELIGEYPA